MYLDILQSINIYWHPEHQGEASRAVAQRYGKLIQLPLVSAATVLWDASRSWAFAVSADLGQT